MKRTFLAPLATDAPEQLADWVELQAILAPERQFSLESLARVINRSGSTDALDEDDVEDDEAGGPGPRAHRHPGDESRLVAEAAFSELEGRVSACRGHRDAYPFELQAGLLKLKGSPGDTDYEFLLLLTYSKPTAGHNGTAVLFEHLCTAAALGHLGGSRNSARALRFGAPRKRPLAKLQQALEDLCRALGEGGGCTNPEAASHTGDGQLDIVAYREFPDGRPGKLVAFGQCAAGVSSAEGKLSELDPKGFMKKWLRKALLVDPLRLFFIPWRPPVAEWDFKVIDSGLLFDRCRISANIEQEQFDVIKDAVRAANGKLLKALRAAA